ncbi:MAG: hypothetical protein MK213_07305, partial [Planctomycetes bacterium]|nr:hypothetical protein [Planctomycetota bacterium]
MLLLTTALLCTPAPVQDSPVGIENLVETLRTSTLERRKAAQEEWARHGQGFLRAPSTHGLERFAPFAPEIQMPMLAELDARIISGDSLSPVL